MSKTRQKCFTSNLRLIPAFFDIGDATKVILPYAIEVAECAFYDRRHLKHVDAPLLTKVGDSAFMYCSQLDLRCLSKVVMFCTRACAYAGNGGDVCLRSCAFIGVEGFAYSNIGVVNAPVLHDAARHAFRGSTVISVSCPRLMHIPSNFAKECSKLREVHCMQVQSIGDAAFSDCRMLNYVKVAAAPTVPIQCFFNCARLSEFNLDTTETVACEAFSGAGITRVVSFRITSIHDCAFRYTSRLKSAHLPMCKHIGSRAFERSGAELNIDFGMALPPKCLVLGPYCFASANIKAFSCNSHLEIGYASFMASTIAKLSAPHTYRIYAAAFQGAMVLTPLTFDGVKAVSPTAFKGATIASVALNSATFVAHAAFERCTAKAIFVNAARFLPRWSFLGAVVDTLSAANVRGTGEDAFLCASIGRISCGLQCAKTAHGPTFTLKLSGRTRTICALSSRVFWRVLITVVLSLRRYGMCDDVIKLVLWQIPDERFISCYTAPSVSSF